MKTFISIAVAALIAAGFTTVILYDHLTGYMPWSTREEEGVIRSTIHSNVLDEDREVIVHLPVNYNSGKEYPVMYVLDGGTEDGRLASAFGVLAGAGYADETIVVGIPNMTAENRERNLVPPFMNIDAEDPNSPAGGGEQFLLFIESELIPFIDTHYAASAVRLLSGNSRGGLLVMYSLIQRPELFAGRFCYSTPFWRQDNVLPSQVRKFLLSQDSLNTFIYLSSGANETENIRSGLAEMAKVFHDNAPPGTVWSSQYTPGAVHANNARISSAMAIRKWSEYQRRPEPSPR